MDKVTTYAKLDRVLTDAYEQAAEGKGKERHAQDDVPFEQQVSAVLTREVGIGYPIGQACKKGIEAQRLSYEAAYKELLGAINYLAIAAIIVKERIGKPPHHVDG